MQPRLSGNYVHNLLFTDIHTYRITNVGAAPFAGTLGKGRAFRWLCGRAFPEDVHDSPYERASARDLQE